MNPGGSGVRGVDMISAIEYVRPFDYEFVERFDTIGFDSCGGRHSEPAFAFGNPGEMSAPLSSIELSIDTDEDMANGQAATHLCIQSMGCVAGSVRTPGAR